MFFSIVSIIEIKRIALKAVKTTEKPQTLEPIKTPTSYKT